MVVYICWYEHPKIIQAFWVFILQIRDQQLSNNNYFRSFEANSIEPSYQVRVLQDTKAHVRQMNIM